MEEEIEKRKGEWVKKGRMEERKRQAERAEQMEEKLKELRAQLEQVQNTAALLAK
ncbi:hypothetical protein K469DRAFT_714817 [Zopfia rhizophila CBS 207.26]|uniref:Uncharacterized protein n=1 Tax=Zopfia rhizophila CBS 207.26 TaxID=1314779 RepID=A0A6A6DS05_9PEZI|nr:hypothetical protein K469DRAFT_714817 [Zopfia rhizophila CBS 207.26]